MARFEHLLSPLQVGPKVVRNRVLLTAHIPGLAVNGIPGEAYAAYHRRKAKSGAGPAPGYFQIASRFSTKARPPS